MTADYVLFVRSEAVEFYRSLRRAEKDVTIVVRILLS